MGKALILPKELHPGFAAPFAPVTDPVRVSRTNQIARKLGFCLIPTQGNIDLVTKDRLTLGSGVSFVGGAYKFDESANGIITIPDSDQNFDKRGDSTQFSLVLDATFLTHSQLFPALAGRGDTSANEWMFRDSYNNSGVGQLGFYANVASFNVNSPTNTLFTEGERARFGVTVDSSGAHIYKNGVLIASDTTGSLDVSSITKAITIGGADGNSTRYFNGLVYAAYGFFQPLSDAEMFEFCGNPKQVLEPYVPITYLIPSAGGGYTLSAGSGSYSLNGSVAVLVAARKLSGTSGAYSLSGSSAALRADRKINAASGTYSLSGTDVTLTYTPASSSYTLTGDSGSYALTGASAVLAASRQISAGSGSYSLNGASVGLAYGRNLSASSGAYSISGTNVSLVKHSALQAASGAYGLSGSPITFSYSGSLAYLGRAMVTTDRARAMLTSDQPRTMTASSPQRNMLH